MAESPSIDSPPVPFLSRQLVGFPSALPPLIGRERETAALCDLMRKPAARLITVTGTGGVGKTRLALAAATEIAATFADGAVFVPLAAISDAAFVLPAIATAVQVRETLGRSLLDALIAALQDRHVLLVLDNFEHVMAAAPDLSLLLQRCPQLTALVTSRAPLHHMDEERLMAPPLALPDPGDEPTPDALLGFDAIALFVERAQWASRGFALDRENAAPIVEICHRLDGLPLAIELAAAWVRVLPPASLLERLEPRLALLHGGPLDHPARHRAMHAAISWSYDLLSADEARLFRRLSIFVGGFTIEAAEWVFAIGREDGPGKGEDADLLDLLAALIDKNLIQPAHLSEHAPRYQMLETIREFAAGQLTERGERPAIEAAHAACFLVVAERAEPHLLGPDELLWQARIDAELANLRAALTWSIAHDIEQALRISSALWVYWSWYQLAEGRRWLGAALERSLHEPARTRARALTTHAALAALEGDVTVAFASSRVAIALAREADDAVSEAKARWIAACGHFYAGQPQAGVPELDEALVLFEQATTTTDRAWGANARSHRASVAFMAGNVEQGLAFYEESLAQARAINANGIVLAILGDFAGCLIDLSDLRRARGMLEEAVALALDRRGSWLLLYPLLSLAVIDAIEGAAETATLRLGAAESMMAFAGLDPPIHYQARIARATALARETLGSKAFDAAWAKGRSDPAAVIAQASGRAVSVSDTWDEGVPPYGLTRRQLEVLRLLEDGRTDRQIATALYVTRRTASKHVAAILAKLGVESRTAAVAAALRSGLL